MSAYSLAVFGVQPLRFRRPEQDLSYADAMLGDQDRSMDVDMDEAPVWVTALEGLYPNRHFSYRRLQGAGEVELDGLQFALHAHVCSNTVLNQHLVLFELRADAVEPASIDESRLRASLVRAAAESDDRRPPAIRQLIAQACDRIAQAHAAIDPSDGYASEDFVVERDSCNVTLFWLPRGQEGKRSLELDRRVCAGGNAERMTADRVECDVSDETRLFFGGRLHHVVSSSANDMHVIRQIMLMLQAVWFYVPLYLRHASWCHRQILGRQSGYDLDELEWAAKRLIHIYQTVHLQNEFAKYSYGVMCGAVYEPCEKRWGVERSVGQFESYATFFRAFIRDAREVQSRKSSQILNYVLAGLGLFGIVGLWADILGSQVAVRDIGSFRGLVHIVGGSTLGFITLVFIAVSLVVAIWLVVYSMRIERGKTGEKGRAIMRRRRRD